MLANFVHLISPNIEISLIKKFSLPSVAFTLILSTNPFLFRYYEAEVLSNGFVRVGWTMSDTAPNVDLGTEAHSFAFECNSALKFQQESAAFGKVCQIGDVVGCMLDLTDHTISEFEREGSHFLKSTRPYLKKLLAYQYWPR